jgi:hypothetical protein
VGENVETAVEGHDEDDRGVMIARMIREDVAVEIEKGPLDDGK